MGLQGNARDPLGYHLSISPKGYDMRMKLDILIDLNPVYTGDKVHLQFFQNCRTLWQMAHGLITEI